MRDIVYLNGQYVEREDAKVSVEDRGYQFADGIYEVTRFHGRRGLRLKDHQERLAKSARYMKIEGAPSPAQWFEIIERLLDECQVPDDENVINCLYQQVTRGTCPRAHLFPKGDITPAAVAYLRAAPAYPATLRETGIALSAQPDERWEKCYIKSIALLPAIWAKQAAVDAGAFEAMQVRNGIVTEGASTNIFCVLDGQIHTHPEGNHILTGVTRQLVLEAADQAGIPVVQRPVPVSEFLKAQEAFISSTTLDVMPVTRVDDTVIGNGQVGPVTRRIMENVNEIIARDLQGHLV